MMPQSRFIKNDIFNSSFCVMICKTAALSIHLWTSMTSVKLCKTTDNEALADQKEYVSIVGGLKFATWVTRPDIMCATGHLSQFLNNLSSKHMEQKRVLKYLKDTLTFGITYRPSPRRLAGYSDVDWAGDIDTRRSITGYVVMLNNGAISWRSQRQGMVALSIMETE